MTSCPHCMPKIEQGEPEPERPVLEALLPKGYAHVVCSYEETAPGQFEADLRLKITSEQEVNEWLEDFQASSGSTWRIAKTYPDTGGSRRNAYRVDFRCMHNIPKNTSNSSKEPKQPPKKPRQVVKKTKNTLCGAFMYLVLKKQNYSQDRKSRSENPHLQEGDLFKIHLKHKHNHELWGAEALQNRDVSAETTAKLKMLFESGHSPKTALETIKYDLQMQEGKDYIYAASDRSICPDLYFCYRLYYRVFQRGCGSLSKEEMLVGLKDRLHQYNMAQGDTSVKMEETEKGEVVVAMCTPLMRRVHTKLEESGEIIFVDSSGKCDRKKHYRIFLLVTHSAIGGLPLGVLITSSENEYTMTIGLRLLQTLLPSGSFFGREQPRFIMTDDCPALRQSLQAVFPESELLPCAFYQMRAMWKWLWKEKTSVDEQDRPSLLNSFKSLIYANTTRLLTAQYNSCMADPVASKYPSFLQQVAEVYGGHRDWAICLHNDPRNTNIFAESAVQVLKEKVFRSLKGFNATQWVDFVTVRLEAYYRHRLTGMKNNRQAANPLLRGNPMGCESIEQVDQNHYVVGSATSELRHNINTEIGCCTCSTGVAGVPCEHQSAVWNKFGHPESTVQVVTPRMRKLYNDIAIGDLGSAQDNALEEHDLQEDGLQEESIDEEGPSIDIQMDSMDDEGPSHTESSSSGTSVEHLKVKLQQFCEDLTIKLRDNPQTFAAPMRTFLDACKKMDDDRSLASALRCFGRVPRVPTKNLQSPNAIGIQPTPIATRKEALGERRALMPKLPPQKVFIISSHMAGAPLQLAPVQLMLTTQPPNLSGRGTIQNAVSLNTPLLFSHAST